MSSFNTVGMAEPSTTHEPSKTSTPMHKDTNPGGHPATVTPSAPSKPGEHKKA